MVVDTFALTVGVQAAAAVVTADEALVFALLAVRVVIVCDGGHAHADERQRPDESADELDDTRCPPAARLILRSSAAMRRCPSSIAQLRSWTSFARPCTACLCAHDRPRAWAAT
jgi:hypothetical protein